MPSPVVTGLGTVGSFGAGRGCLAEALRTSTVRDTEVDRAQAYHGGDGARRAALVGALDLTAWVPAGAARRMSPPSKLAVAAARMALLEAGLPLPAPGATPDGAVEVVLSTAFGPASFTERLLQGILGDGPETASPFLFTECVANAPAAQVAIACRATGPNVTITQREAGPLLAVGRAATDVVAGRALRALAGASDEAPPIVHAVLDRFGSLAHAEDGLDEQARPFDRRRNGFLLGEGAAVVVIEEEEAARRRGASVLARVRAWGSAFDATASRVSWGEGAQALSSSLLRMLRRAGLRPEDIDLVASGASGAVAGDRLEALTLKAAWGGAPLPPVLAPKAVVAEYGGGALAASVLAASGAPFGPTRGFSEVDPALGLAPHDGRALPAPRRTLVTALAAGGAAAWVVLERP